MLLFHISGSALGKNILRGEQLSYDDVLLTLSYIEAYSRIVPVSFNITSKNYDNNMTPHDYIDLILVDEFLNGARRPHLVYLEDHKISLPSGRAIFSDTSQGKPFESDGVGYHV